MKRETVEQFLARGGEINSRSEEREREVSQKRW